MVAVVALTAPPAAAQLSALISINNNWVRQYSKKHDVNKHTHEKNSNSNRIPEVSLWVGINDNSKAIS